MQQCEANLGFPAVRSIAHYDPRAFYIELSTINSTELVNSIKYDNRENKLKVLPLLSHEATHYEDHVSTLWGIKRVIAYLEALEARELNRVDKFWKIIKFINLENAGWYSDYYEVILDSSYDVKKFGICQYAITVGKRFDHLGMSRRNASILFVNLLSNCGRRHLARCPISAASLLETRAMFSEFDTIARCIGDNNDNESNFLRKYYSDEGTQTLHDISLIKYTAAAHLVSRILGVSDGYDAFRISSMLARICLDFPVNLYERIKCPVNSEIHNDTADSLLRSNDCGCLFYILLQHGMLLWKKDMDLLEWIDGVLNCAGLQCLDHFQRCSMELKLLLWEKASVVKYGKLFDVLRADGVRLQNMAYVATKDSYTLPHVLCKDQCLVFNDSVVDGVLRIGFDKWFLTASNMRIQFEEFRAACFIEDSSWDKIQLH